MFHPFNCLPFVKSIGVVHDGFKENPFGLLICCSFTGVSCNLLSLFCLDCNFCVLSRLFGCSGVGSGRAGASGCAAVRCCFVELPSAVSSARCRFGGDGIAGLL